MRDDDASAGEGDAEGDEESGDLHLGICSFFSRYVRTTEYERRDSAVGGSYFERDGPDQLHAILKDEARKKKRMQKQPQADEMKKGTNATKIISNQCDRN